MLKLYLKPYLILAISYWLLAIGQVQAQNVGINITGTTPSGNAILDLNSGNAGKLGLLIPNVNLTALTTFNPPIANAATAGDVGMLVYNTNGGVGNGVGYYYWNGVTWVSAGGAGGGGLAACGGALANYIPYFTSASGVCNSVIYQASTTTLGIGIITPQNMLDVSGAMAVGTYAGANIAPVGTNMIISGQTGVGTNAPNGTAILDLTSTTLGFLTPRMTVTQITAIANPAIGLVVYNTTTNCLEFNSTGTSTGWNDIICPCAAPPSAVGAITGPSSICTGTTGTYTIAAVTNATTYTWSSSNTGIAFLSSVNGSTTATFTGGLSSGFVTITVVASNNCGSTSNTITVWNGNPPNATTPVGPNSPTISTTVTYTCATVPSATSYTWSVSSTNATIASGQGTQTITVTLDATPSIFDVCVTANNACGSSTPACLAVSSTTCPSTSTTNNYSWNGSSTNYTGTIQTWTVPVCANTITVTLVGGGGGNSYSGALGGKGASLTGTLAVTPGDVLDILVGGGGTDPNADYGGSGGGGTFIWDATTNTLLAVAGGGGGAAALLLGGSPNGGAGQTTITSLATLETPTLCQAGAGSQGAGGTAGGAGAQGAVNVYCGAGGAGWLANSVINIVGTPSWIATSYYPESGITPGYGMEGSSANDGFAGFGGGGGGAFNAGGGGGGYNGGGGGTGNSGFGGAGAGGGGSYWQNYSNITSTSFGAAAGANRAGINGSASIIFY